MKVEIHSHTLEHSPCSTVPLKELLGVAEMCGYDAIFLTDHGKIWTPDEIKDAQSHCSRLRVFPGIEVTLQGGYDVLVLGAQDEAYENVDTPDEVFAMACADDCLTVLAHPFRWHETLPPFASLSDAIEVYTCNHPELEKAARSQAYAEEFNMAPVHSGDTHGLNFLNKFWIETEGEFETPQEFRRMIIAGQYQNRLRETGSELPPTYKAATLDELSEADMAALDVQPTA